MPATNKTSYCPHCHLALALAATTHCTNANCGKRLDAPVVLFSRVKHPPVSRVAYALRQVIQ
jgi:hypothetical protein